MAQVTLNNSETISRLKTDSQFRKDFLANTSKLLTQSGHPIDEDTLGKALEKQLGPSGLSSTAASTAIIITVF